MGTWVTSNTPLPTPKIDAHPPVIPEQEIDAADVNNLWGALADVRSAIVGPDAVYTASGTGAVARSLPSKLGDVLSVKDFGVKGDGVTDDTAALVAAKTAAGTSKTLIINVKARIAGAVGTISGPVRFQGNGALDLTAGGSVSLTGPIDAPMSQIFYVAPIARPVNAAHTLGAGTLASATYWYRVTALNAQGETFPSTETSLAITGPAGVNVNWGAVSGATGYKVYGRTAGGEQLLATVGAVTTWLDGGSVTPAGAPTATDTTSGLQVQYAGTTAFYPAWWGAKGDAATDDTVAVQQALWMAGVTQGIVKVIWTHRITSVLIPPQNVTIEGVGPKSRGIYADGCAAFQILGKNYFGGFAFRVGIRDLGIQLNATPAGTKVIEIDTAYNVDIDRVYIPALPDGVGTYGVYVNVANDITFDNFVLRGATGSSHTGISVNGAATVTLIRPDIENLHVGVLTSGGATVTLHAPYMERNTISISNQGSGLVTSYGGAILGINSGTYCIQATASSQTIVLGTLLSPGSGTHTIYALASGAKILWYDTAGQRIFQGAASAVGDIPGLVPILPYFAAVVPSTGAHFAGEKVFNSAPAVGSPKGWVCTVSGTPGTWVSEGNL